MGKINKVILETRGERIKAERERLDFTQEAFADLVDLSKQQLSNYELNKRQPDYDTLVKIAQSLNVSTDYILGNTESKNTENTEISRKLGLSDKSIEKLSTITRKTSFDLNVPNGDITNNEYNSVIINKLIEDDNFEILIHFIKQYINSFKIEELKKEIMLNKILYEDNTTGEKITNRDVLISAIEAGVYNENYQESSTDIYAYKINFLFNKIIESIVEQVEPTFAQKWTLNEDKTEIVPTNESDVWEKYKKIREKGSVKDNGSTRNNKKQKI